MIQVDGEPAIKTLSEAVITSLNGDLKSRLAPSYSHQPLGACEGWRTKLFSHLVNQCYNHQAPHSLHQDPQECQFHEFPSDSP
eukprot:1707705-Amphidinium_carterae.1